MTNLLDMSFTQTQNSRIEVVGVDPGKVSILYMTTDNGNGNSVGETEKAVKSLLAAKGALYYVLPWCSPELNPIERY